MRDCLTGLPHLGKQWCAITVGAGPRRLLGQRRGEQIREGSTKPLLQSESSYDVARTIAKSWLVS